MSLGGVVSAALVISLVIFILSVGAIFALPNLPKAIKGAIDAIEMLQRLKEHNKIGKWEKWKVISDPFKGKATFVGLCSKCGRTTEFVFREEHSSVLPYAYCPKCGFRMEQIGMEELRYDESRYS